MSLYGNGVARRKESAGEKLAGALSASVPSSLFVFLLLLIIGVGIYGQTAYFGFQETWDDPPYVSRNPYIRDGLTWSAIGAAFSAPQTGSWHPLTMLSHALDVSLFGIAPGGHHLVNALLHVLGSWAVFSLLRVCAIGYWRAASVAVLFLVHPLQVESVAWISERKNLLCILFWLLAAQYYVKWQRGQGTRSELICFVFALAALLAKPAAVMLPVTLLLLDYWPLGRLVAVRSYFSRESVRRLFAPVREKALFFVVALVVACITYYIQNLRGFTWLNETTTWTDRAGNALAAYGVYLGRFLLPDGLHYYYPWQRPEWLATVLPVGLLLAVISWGLWRLRERHPVMLFGWLWFLIVPLPTLGLIQVGGQGSADRYMHVPMLGLLLILVHLFALSRQTFGRTWPVLLLVPLLSWSALAYQQTATWASDDTRLQRALIIDPSHCHARLSFSALLLDRGQLELARAWLDDVRNRCASRRSKEWADRLQARMDSLGEAPLRRALASPKGS